MLPQLHQRPKKIATCEQCDKQNVEVWVTHGNILMCKDCREEEQEKLRRSDEAKQIIDDSRKNDANVQLKQDVFLSKATAFVELRAAIWANTDIKDEDKQYALVKEVDARRKHLQAVIFEDRQALLEKENEYGMWLVNGQSEAGKLRTDLRAHFKELDINYQPTPITKTQKTTKPVKQAKRKYTTAVRAEIAQSCQKYNIPSDASNHGVVWSLMDRKNLSADDAAKHLAGLLGLM